MTQDRATSYRTQEKESPLRNVAMCASNSLINFYSMHTFLMIYTSYLSYNKYTIIRSYRKKLCIHKKIHKKVTIYILHNRPFASFVNVLRGVSRSVSLSRALTAKRRTSTLDLSSGGEGVGKKTTLILSNARICDGERRFCVCVCVGLLGIRTAPHTHTHKHYHTIYTCIWHIFCTHNSTFMLYKNEKVR